MIKFRITPERFAEACSIYEYLATQNAHRETVFRIARLFIVDNNDEYIVKPVLDDDGDIKAFENDGAALLLMTKVTPKRLEKLVDEFARAAKSIMDPPKGGG